LRERGERRSQKNCRKEKKELDLEGAIIFREGKKRK